MHGAWIYQTRSGSLEMPVELSGSSWTRLLSGEGSGSHTLPVRGLPRSLVDEITTGNRYSLAVTWNDTYIPYAGVIVGRRKVDANGTYVLRTKELPAALFGKRMTFGVNQYNPASGQLVVSNRSYSGAVRAILTAAMAPSSEWVLPIDLPADGSGGFSETWRHEETLTLKNLLQQIRDEGNEVDFRPYLSGQVVRHQTRVAPKIVSGSVTDLPVQGGSLVVGLKQDEDFLPELTGVLAMGNGYGQDKKAAFAPASGSGATTRPVMDAKVDFPDIKKQSRLQAAADAYYAAHQGPVEQIDFDVWVYGQGPEDLEPGRLVDMWSYGGTALPDGQNRKRIVGLRGDLGWLMTPEVESYGA